MADFTALKEAIQDAIKQNGQKEITGEVLQTILLSMVSTLGDSAINNLVEALAAAVTALQNSVGDEATARQSAVATLTQNLNTEAQTRAYEDNQLNTAIQGEAYTRGQADNQIRQDFTEALSEETAARINGDSTLTHNLNVEAQARAAAILNEATIRQGEDYQLRLQINGLSMNFDDLLEDVRNLIRNYNPIVINGDVTNAPDENDLTTTPNNLLKFKDNVYNPIIFSGMGKKFLRKNLRPLSTSYDFDGFVENINPQEELSGTPAKIFWDREGERFVGWVDGVYYLAWTDDDAYVPVSTENIYMYDGNPYKWNGEDFYVDDEELPNVRNVLTQDMINEANTIYVIRYDYTLAEDITIPANCVLEFDGGSISGTYPLTGQNTFIKAGNVHCFNNNVNFAGTWIGTFNIYWLGLVSNNNTFDNAPIIQKALRTFPNTYIPVGTYYCSTTIDASPHTVEMYSEYPVMNFTCDGSLAYITQNTSNRFIQIGGYNSVIKINSIHGPNNNITNDTEKSIGISLYDCNGTTIYINSVSGFHTDIEFLGGEKGFAYNDITVANLGAALILAHLNTVTGGWVNSNRFKFLRMYAFSGQTKADTAILVKGEGEYGFNENVFEKLSIEGINKSGAGAPIKLKKCSDFIIGPYRNENNNVPFINISGTCKNIKIIPNYYVHHPFDSIKMSAEQGSNIQYSELLPYNQIEWKPFANCPILNGKFISRCGYTRDLSNEIPTSAPGYEPVMALFTTSLCDIPIVVRKYTGDLHIAYYDVDYNMLDKANYSDYKPISNGTIVQDTIDAKMFLLKSTGTLATLLIPSLPNEVKYIGIGFCIDDNNFKGVSDGDFSILFTGWIVPSPIHRTKDSVWGLDYRHPLIISGTTQNRRSNGNIIGSSYFDETLGKPIWYAGKDGNNNDIWVDATGATV